MFTPSPNRSPAADHHVAHVDANAEVDALVWWQAGVCFGESSLRLHRALHGIHGAAELRKDTVACRVRDAASVVRNGLVEDRTALSEPLERPNLISAHEAAIAFHVSREDCYQSG